MKRDLHHPPRQKWHAASAGIVGTLCLTLLCGIAEADIIRLQSGGVLRGTLSEDVADSEIEESVQITLLSGAIVGVPREAIRDIEQRSLKIEVYETNL